MKIMYVYYFADGFVARFPKELTFNLLKIAINGHKGLINVKKVAVIEDNVDEVEVIA